MTLEQLEKAVSQLKSICDTVYLQIQMIDPSTLLEFKGTVLHTLEEVDKDIIKIQDQLLHLNTADAQAVKDRINTECEKIDAKSSDRVKELHKKIDKTIEDVGIIKGDFKEIKTKVTTYALIGAFALSTLVNFIIPYLQKSFGR